MKLTDVLYKTPEMTEEKLLELIHKHRYLLKGDVIAKLNEYYSLYKMDSDNTLAKAILKEWDKIQIKESNLTKSQRDQILGLVGTCLIMMTKDDESILQKA